MALQKESIVLKIKQRKDAHCSPFGPCIINPPPSCNQASWMISGFLKDSGLVTIKDDATEK